MKKGYINVKNKSDAEKYQSWINENVSEDCKGSCRRAVDKMVKIFPELRIVGIFDYWGISSDHAWCTNKENEIVDPTYHQFEKYKHTDNPLELSDFPEGKCMWCGDIIIPDTPRNQERYLDIGVILGDHLGCIANMRREYG